MDRFSIKRAFVEKIIYKNFSLHLKINHSSKIYIYMYVRSRQLVINVKKRKNPSRHSNGNRNICCQRIGKFSVSMAFSVLAREDLYASLTKRSAPISEQWRPERCNQAQANCSTFQRKPRQLVRNVDKETLPR